MSLIAGQKRPSSESESEDQSDPGKSKAPTVYNSARGNGKCGILSALPENIANEKSNLPDNQELKKKKRAKESKPRAMPQWLPDEVRLFLRCRFATVTTFLAA